MMRSALAHFDASVKSIGSYACRSSTCRLRFHHCNARFYTTDFPSEASELDLTLRAQNFDKWGWAIYRTTYRDPQAWEAFKKTITEWMRETLLDTDVPSLLDSVELTFFDDAAALNNVSRLQLRQHFRKWSSEVRHVEQPRATPVDSNGWTPRYEFFFQIDDEVLDQIKRLGPSLNLFDERAHIKFIQADWRPMGKRGEAADDEEPYDEIDGVREDDVGWMKVPLYWIGYSAYLLMSGPLDTWPHMYQRPPAMCRFLN